MQKATDWAHDTSPAPSAVQSGMSTTLDQLVAALHVALAHAEGTVTTDPETRAAELEGCRMVLDDWTDADSRHPQARLRDHIEEIR